VKVVVTEHIFTDLNITEEVLAPTGAKLVFVPDPTPAVVLSHAKDADALLVCWTPIGREIISGLERCRAIVRFGIGVNNIDMASATSAGIIVANVPDYCIDEVSDHALTLLLCAARKVIPMDKSVRSGTWDVRLFSPVFRFRGKRAGLVGFGRIPRCLARKLKALGIEVVAFDPYVKPEDAAEAGVSLIGLEELLRTSDYVSIHAPATPETRHIINEATLRMMKPTAILVNTARGDLVDQVALARALKEGVIAAAALDVLWDEGISPDDPLLACDNLILTPHAAFYSEESSAELQRKGAEQARMALEGKLPVYALNKEIAERWLKRWA